MQDDLTTQDQEQVEDDSLEGLSILGEVEEEVRRQSTNLFLAVPSWSERLVAEYGLMDPEDIGKMAKRQFRKFQERRRNGGEPTAVEKSEPDLELIARANVGLWVVRPRDGERVLLEDSDGPVTYGRLAAAMNWDHLDGTFKTIRYAMGERDPKDRLKWKDNFTAIALHSASINRYFKDPSARGISIEDLLGEL